MKTLTSLALVGLLACTPHVMAHADHQHEFITESAALGVARQTAVKLTRKDAGLGFGQLPVSWAVLPSEKIKLVKNGEGYYIISVTNDTEGKTLFLLLSSEDGDVYDANFTGEFADLKKID